LQTFLNQVINIIKIWLTDNKIFEILTDSDDLESPLIAENDPRADCAVHA
jgi:hypothetical protein